MRIPRKKDYSIDKEYRTYKKTSIEYNFINSSK